MTYNPKIKNTSNTNIVIDANISANNINLGPAFDNDYEPNDPFENPTYEDGLFTEFNSNTTVGEAIDKINEVLGALAPKSAPNLETLTSNNVNGKVEKLALETDNAVSLLDDPNNSTNTLDLPSTGDHITFSKIYGNGTNEYRRLGTYATKQDLRIILNGMTEQNLQGTIVNYPADAFNTTTSPQQASDVQVWLNNSQLDQQHFNVVFGTEGVASFASGVSFPSSKHNTGYVDLLNTASWRKGHNYLQIKYGSKQTAFVDWVFAEGESVSDTQYAVSLVGFETKNSNTKHISGIEYVDQITYGIQPGSQVSNYAISTYPTDYGVQIISDKQAIATKSSVDIDNQSILVPARINMTTNTLDIAEIKTEQVINQRILNQSLALKVKVTNQHNKTGESSPIVFPNIVMDTFSEEYNTRIDLSRNTILESFSGEKYRKKDDLSTWDSISALTTGAAVYNGRLMSPKSINIGSRNYTTLNGPFTYVRKYTLLNNTINKIKLEISWNSDLFDNMWDVASQNNKWHIEFMDGSGNWKDAVDLSVIAVGTPLSSHAGVGLFIKNIEVEFSVQNGASPIAPINNVSTGYIKITAPAGSTSNQYITQIKTVDYNY